MHYTQIYVLINLCNEFSYIKMVYYLTVLLNSNFITAKIYLKFSRQKLFESTKINKSLIIIFSNEFEIFNCPGSKKLDVTEQMQKTRALYVVWLKYY